MTEQPLFGITQCVTCKSMYEPVCVDSLYCSRKCCPKERGPKDFHQHSYWEEVSLLIERNYTNHCALCNTEVINLCKFETIFCSETHMYADPDEAEEDEWIEEEEEEEQEGTYFQNEIPFAEWKKYNSM